MAFLEILAAIMAGVVLGIFTGLTPGLHINLVAAAVVHYSGTLLAYATPLQLAAGIIAMSVTHSFVDFIPSTLLGAPSDATALAVLPGHKLLLKGRGYEAVMLSAFGGVAGVLAIVVLLPLLLPLVRVLFDMAKPFIGFALVGVIAFNIFRARTVKGKTATLAVIMLSGFLGLLALNIPNFKQPLMPLLSGLFGVSTLISSLISSSPAPIQVSRMEPVKRMELAKTSVTGAFSGALMGVFPALGPAQAAVLARNAIGKTGNKGYLMTLGAVSTTSMLFGLVTLYAIGKARNGSIAAMAELTEVSAVKFLLLMAVSLISAGIAVMAVKCLASFIAANLYRVDYRKISLSIILLILVLVLAFSGLTGLIVIATGSSIGMMAILLNVERHNLMACLIMPVVLLYI